MREAKSGLPKIRKKAPKARGILANSDGFDWVIECSWFAAARAQKAGLAPADDLITARGRRFKSPVESIRQRLDDAKLCQIYMKCTFCGTLVLFSNSAPASKSCLSKSRLS
jgi:hypothetical protein